MAVAIDEVLMWLSLDGFGHALASTGAASWHFTLCGKFTPDGELAIKVPGWICPQCIQRLSESAPVAGKHPPKRKPRYPKRGQGETLKFLKAHVNHQGDDCLIWPFSRKETGYGHFGFDGKMRSAHRFMCELAHGPAPEGMQAAHECGNGSGGCVNPKHLKWKTQGENERDKHKHGTAGPCRKGEKRKKLNAEQVVEIRSLIGTMAETELAALYGVTRGHIYLIKTGKVWPTVGLTGGSQETAA